MKLGDKVDQRQLVKDLVALQYKRMQAGDFSRGLFRVRGDTIEMFPAHYEDRAWRIGFFGDEIEAIAEFDPLTGQKTQDLEFVKIYANSHYVTPRPTLLQSIEGMKLELKQRLDQLNRQGRLLEAQRLEQRTLFDLEMLEATGSCAGIENYSRYLTGRRPGEPPPTLFEYLPDNALVFTDESHVTIPQIGGMYRGDYRRKATLAEYGFRLPSCMDNRPLRFEEWEAMRPQTVHVSATPGHWELEQTEGAFVEQVIRPTGLIDPPVEIRPARSQVDDLLSEVKQVALRGYRTLITTLTKRMAEDLTEYLHENGVRVRYMHSDIDTIERIEIIRDLRLGAFDALVGINLLREGLDIPECAFVAILDADKEGFLRSETSLVQTIGRAARNVEGKVVLYADVVTGSIERAIGETDRRRLKQQAYNEANGITPGIDQARHPGHSGLGLRGRPCDGRHWIGRRSGHRPQFASDDRRAREADEGGGGQSRIRAGGAPARRDQAPAIGRARGRRRPAGAAGGDRGGSGRLRRPAPVRTRRQPAVDEAPQADRRRHGPAQLGRRRSPPEGRGQDEEAAEGLIPSPVGRGAGVRGPRLGGPRRAGRNHFRVRNEAFESLTASFASRLGRARLPLQGRAERLRRRRARRPRRDSNCYPLSELMRLLLRLLSFKYAA